MGMTRIVGKVKGKFTKRKMEKILGRPSWEWKQIIANKSACGLAEGRVYTAGWGDTSACCRIWVHKDGICIGPGLSVAEDIEYAKNTYRKIIKALKQGKPPWEVIHE